MHQLGLRGGGEHPEALFHFFGYLIDFVDVKKTLIENKALNDSEVPTFNFGVPNWLCADEVR